jgi:hypothetical protein
MHHNHIDHKHHYINKHVNDNLDQYFVFDTSTDGGLLQ